MFAEKERVDVTSSENKRGKVVVECFKGPLYKRTKGEGEEFDEDAKRRGLGAGG